MTRRSQAVADGCLISFAVFAAVAFVASWSPSTGTRCSARRSPRAWRRIELELEPRKPFPLCCWREEQEVFDTDIEKVVPTCPKPSRAARRTSQAILTNILDRRRSGSSAKTSGTRSWTRTGSTSRGSQVRRRGEAHQQNKALSQLVNALLSDRFDFGAQTLHEAMKGFGRRGRAHLHPVHAGRGGYLRPPVRLLERYERSLEQAVIERRPFKRVCCSRGATRGVVRQGVRSAIRGSV